MEYLNVKKAAERWKTTERRVSALCREGRVAGAVKENGSWLIPANAHFPEDKRTKSGREEKLRQFVEQHGGAQTENKTVQGGYERVVEAFTRKYLKPPENVTFAPFRICPLGAHSDHNLGKITGLAIDKGIYLAYGAMRNGVVEVTSMQFPKPAQWHVAVTPQEKQGDWADYLRGATLALNARYPIRNGIFMVLDGELAIGGISSSAAVVVGFAAALAKVNGLVLKEQELIDIAYEAENHYVGVACGKMDPACVVLSRKNRLLYMDFKNGSHECIARNGLMKDFEIAIISPGTPGADFERKFNRRVDEARAAAYSLAAFTGVRYCKFSEANLRDIPYEAYLAYRDRLPVSFAKRCEHWYGEYRRVEAGVDAWRQGDLERFGELTFESGRSSIENWEAGTDELINIYNTLTETDGVYGGRFSGAGFRGCCMALIDPVKREDIEARVKQEFGEAFPGLKDKIKISICKSADGIKII